ncbi:MAG: zinc ribbon domain-containing protein [Candidatus Heimdallarchaeota archaeon]|nr:MAG: zinc ribbon domain-containing protein [Candidatus Heimdallarchaeota archaeon]
MASRLSIVGIILLVLGGILLIVFTLILPITNAQIPLIRGGVGSDSIEDINRFSTRTIDVANVNGGILGMPASFIKIVYVIGNTDRSTDYTVTVLYNDQDFGVSKSYSEEANVGYKTRSFQFTVVAPSSTDEYTLKLRIQNTGSNDITLGSRLVLVTPSLFSTILPILFVIIGLILTIVGFIKRGPAVPKPRPAPGGWEPTLQWGGGAKQPKMAIKSETAAPKPTQRKVVKKAAAGDQSCKFCGKSVPASAFFCPHCYGKLR